MKTIYVLMIISVLWSTGCSNHSEMTTSTGFEDNGKIQFPDYEEVADVDSLTKCRMYRESMKSFLSTSPNYVVVVVKNKNSGIVKEICTESTSVFSAIGKEGESKIVKTVNERTKPKMIKGLLFDEKSYPNRYFEFGDKEALSSIDFDLYTKSELENYSRSMNVSKIVKDVKSGKIKNKTFTGERKEQIMFAHIMINKGVMVASGCIAGNVCSLECFKQ